MRRRQWLNLSEGNLISANTYSLPVLWRRLCLCGLLAITSALPAQKGWTQAWQLNAGCNLTFYYGKGQHFPGLKVFGGISINTVYKGHLMINYAGCLGLYVRSLGNNLNPLHTDLQLDFTNCFMGGFAGGDSVHYTKYLRTINNLPFNSLFIQRSYAAWLGTNFIFNNHRRNQTIGTLGVNVEQVSANYSNDGPPFGAMGLGDSFDRWWTGHGCLYVHSLMDYNYVELGFDQFTGYSPLLYELSGILGIDVPDYNIEHSDSTGTGKKSTDYHGYNSSTYNLRINFDRSYGLDLGAIGSLRSKNNNYYAFQDIIHRSRRYALHPNQDVNRGFIGPTYRYTYKP